MDCIFCKIINHELPANIVDNHEDIIVIRDITPQAPTHLLVIPKKHIATIDDAKPEDALLLGKMILAAQQCAKNEGLSEGYRLVFNVNRHGCQAVYHIHLHVLGGKQMGWPPGC